MLLIIKGFKRFIKEECIAVKLEVLMSAYTFYVSFIYND